MKFVVTSYCKRLWLIPAHGRTTEEETDSPILGFISALKDWTGPLLFLIPNPGLVIYTSIVSLLHTFSDASTSCQRRGCQIAKRVQSFILVILSSLRPAWPTISFNCADRVGHELYIREISGRNWHVRSERAAIARFQQLFEEEMDQYTIQNLYNWYTKRLHDCRRAGGQMTRY